ncbi:MAG: N-acetylmuramoyl-L-alanine amidase [Roseovarius indicus]
MTPSPNCGERRGGVLPDMIVLHYTGMESCAAAHERLCDPGAEVSAHYLISETGALWQLVPEALRAWHAGAGHWAGTDDVNSRSIGIELVNTGTAPFPEPQMAALEGLMRGIMARWSIEAHRVIAHSDMAPDRKFDPGPRFDWRRLALSGLSVWPELAAGGAFLEDARRFGYPPEAAPEEILHAFRLRFRPWASGPADAIDASLAADLASRFPVDRAAPSA